MTTSKIRSTARSIISLFRRRSKTAVKRPAGVKAMKPVYDYSFLSMEGKTISFAEYKGKKILIVNVASRCGFTPQYEDLEKLYEMHKDIVTVVGFPSNDFMGQEPGSNEEISSFCRVRYGVTFPLAQKGSVVGDGMQDVYRWLTDKSLNGWNDVVPKWNFQKYLVNESGELVAVFPPGMNPMSEEILGAIKERSANIQ